MFLPGKQHQKRPKKFPYNKDFSFFLKSINIYHSPCGWQYLKIHTCLPELTEDDQQFIYSRAEKTLLTDEEAIVRRECVDFVSSVVFLLNSRELEQKLSNLLIHVLRLTLKFILVNALVLFLHGYDRMDMSQSRFNVILWLGCHAVRQTLDPGLINLSLVL